MIADAKNQAYRHHGRGKTDIWRVRDIIQSALDSKGSLVYLEKLAHEMWIKQQIGAF